MDGYRLSGRTGWKGEEREKPFMKEQLECMEPCFWTVEKPVERLWVRISGRPMWVMCLVVCYRPPGQDIVDEAFFRKLVGALHLHTLVLIVGLAILIPAGRAT